MRFAAPHAACYLAESLIRVNLTLTLTLNLSLNLNLTLTLTLTLNLNLNLNVSLNPYPDLTRIIKGNRRSTSTGPTLSSGKVFF